MPFKKGQSGNPSGKSRKGNPNGIDVRRLCQDLGGKAIDALVRELRGKNAIAAAKEILDRGFGKSIQALELSGPDKEPISISFPIKTGAK